MEILSVVTEIFQAFVFAVVLLISVMSFAVMMSRVVSGIAEGIISSV